MLKIGYMDYANVYPIFHFLLQDENLSFKKGFPADLNKALRQGEIHVSPSSCIEFCRHPDKYKIIDNISVASEGPVKSVCLFSDFAPDKLGGKKIVFTKESNTSTVLCRVILEKFYNVTPVYTENRAEASAELLIGDKALIEYYANSRSGQIVDLGAEWYKFTGLPFVFALWLAGVEAVGDEYFSHFRSELLRIAAESPYKRHAFLDRYVEKGLTPAQMDDYWQVIDYSLSEKYKEGLALFYKYVYELGETAHKDIDIKSSLV